VHVVPLLYEDLADPKVFPALLSDLEIPFDPAMLDWSLSKKCRPGGFAFEQVRQPNLDSSSFDGVAESREFVVRRSPARPSFVVEGATADVAGLNAARSIYAAVARWRQKPLRPAGELVIADVAPAGAA